MKNNFLIEYSDSFSLNKKIDEITKDIKNDAVCTTYDLEDQELQLVMEDLDTYSFLSNKKIIVVKHIELLQSEDNSTKRLLKYLDNSLEDNILILVSNKLDSRKKITKDLKNKTTYLKLEDNPSSIIKNLFNDYKLEDGVINLILEYTNSNIDAISSECEKLINYKYNEKIITREDAKSILYQHQVDENQILFDLIKFIAIKDKKNSLKNYKRLKDLQVDDMAMIALLESQLRLMYQVSLLSDKGCFKQDIAKKLDIHPYRIQKTLELLYSTNIDEVEKLLKLLAEVDYKVKSGAIGANGCIEMLIISIK